MDCELIQPDLVEYHFGEMSGATYAEIREKFGAIANPAERVYPGEEGREVFFDRVTRDAETPRARGCRVGRRGDDRRRRHTHGGLVRGAGCRLVCAGLRGRQRGQGPEPHDPNKCLCAREHS